jgi:hypothetical protein
MTIPVVQYKGFELRSYSHQAFPIFHDPYASGAKRFSSTVRIVSQEPKYLQSLSMLEHGHDEA